MVSHGEKETGGDEIQHSFYVATFWSVVKMN